MADDDKQTSGEDPWAGIEAEPSSGADGGFDFASFDPIDTEFPVETAPESIEPQSAPAVPEFDALALGASDGVFADDLAWSEGDLIQSEGDLIQSEGDLIQSEGDLIQPENDLDHTAGETPLAVFPTVFSPADETETIGTSHEAAEDDFDALAHLQDSHLQDSSGEEDSSEGARSENHSSALAAFGTEESAEDALAFESAIRDGEPAADASLIGTSAVEVGTDHSGIVPFDDWDAMGDGGASRDLDEESFGVTGDAPEFGEEPDTLAASHATATVALAPKRPVKRRSSGGGGLMAALAVVFGGVLSIPIVFALLFWVFRKDPLNIAPAIPQSLSFLLPAEFQIAGRPRPLPRVAGNGPLVAARSGEESAAEPAVPDLAAATEEPAAGDDEPAVSEEPAATVADSVASAAPAARIAEVKPPLDTAAFDEAVASAFETTGRFLASDEADPDRKAILKTWYLSLAKVGEEAAVVEKAAVDSGRAFDPTPDGVARVIGGILADEKAAEQFGKVARMWLRSPKRTSDGVMLPATMGGSKQVGPWWFTKVLLGEGEEATEISVLSRDEPAASAGDRVVVLGLVFEPGTVWAAACRRFEPKPLGKDEEPAASEKPASDDLFPLE